MNRIRFIILQTVLLFVATSCWIDWQIHWQWLMSINVGVGIGLFKVSRERGIL